ncbi:BMP family ABC transporter substrate-binding protein [Paenibacillus oryzisoli]|uniref:BMP family ABC transporter substrate-binding protein n=1 Tax=Paenibacillus oryzisoli TaxID=1850517 RepID=A0A198A5R3_9BACL|nr:BMP family ABC transporter substrate-binding protein [Paenibacillus oryzisoli]OAS16323.1 BMP family ABC transporter substrate-binding protein [Paenibacillus oryzisoli]
MRLFGKKWGIMASSLVVSLTLAACSSTSSPASTAVSGGAAGTGGKAVGFIFVGAKDDYGYNQAAYIGSQGVEKAFPDLKVLRSENVPETAEAERVMEEMIRNGAKIIFPTSYGHLDPALNVAKRHPDVLFYHQGGLKTAANLGTYFGTIWEPVYLAGIAAGKMSKTGKLGYIVSVPIPQVLLNVNAFELGAKSVNPSATTTVVFTGSWCDPAQQANAANSMIDQGIDVLSQHQDCTKTVIETAERRGALSVGYHAEASVLAPKGWITGSIWNWSDLYVDMVKTGIAGTFKGSKYDGKYRGQLKDNVVQLTPYGSAVPEDVKKLVDKGKADLVAGTLNPFSGPIKDQKGVVKIEAGAKLELDKLEATDYFVEGVIGSIPK